MRGEGRDADRGSWVQGVIRARCLDPITVAPAATHLLMRHWMHCLHHGQGSIHLAAPRRPRRAIMRGHCRRDVERCRLDPLEDGRACSLGRTRMV